MRDDIESLLERMPLRKPPASLDARVLWRVRRPRQVVIAWAVAAGALAAAAVALFFAVRTEPRAPAGGPTAAPAVAQADVPAPTDGVSPAEAAAALPVGGAETDVVPVQIERQWTHLAYEGVVAPEGEPMAKFRRQVVDQLEWVDPDDGAHMEMTVPREDVILIKADVY